MNNAHVVALQANPSLASEERDLAGKLNAVRDAGGQPSPDLITELHDFNSKIRAAMILADPHVEPLLAKVEASHPQH